MDLVRTTLLLIRQDTCTRQPPIGPDENPTSVRPCFNHQEYLNGNLHPSTHYELGSTSVSATEARVHWPRLPSVGTQMPLIDVTPTHQVCCIFDLRRKNVYERYSTRNMVISTYGRTYYYVRSLGCNVVPCADYVTILQSFAARTPESFHFCRWMKHSHTIESTLALN